ncbi:hypothetical protein GCM10027599_27710 [Yimella radicis]
MARPTPVGRFVVDRCAPVLRNLERVGNTILYVILALCVLGLAAIGVRALMDRRAEHRQHAYRPERPAAERRRRRTPTE